MAFQPRCAPVRTACLPPPFRWITWTARIVARPVRCPRSSAGPRPWLSIAFVAWTKRRPRERSILMSDGGLMTRSGQSRSAAFGPWQGLGGGGGAGGGGGGGGGAWPPAVEAAAAAAASARARTGEARIREFYRAHGPVETERAVARRERAARPPESGTP